MTNKEFMQLVTIYIKESLNEDDWTYMSHQYDSEDIDKMRYKIVNYIKEHKNDE